MIIKSLLLSFSSVWIAVCCCLEPSKEINYGTPLISFLFSFLLLSFPSSPFQKWNPYSYSFCQPLLFFKMGVSLARGKFNIFHTFIIKNFFNESWASNTFQNVVSICMNKGYIFFFKCHISIFHGNLIQHKNTFLAKSHYFALSLFMYIITYHNHISCCILRSICYIWKRGLTNSGCMWHEIRIEHITNNSN